MSSAIECFGIVEEDSRLTFGPTPLARQHYLNFYHEMIRTFWPPQDVQDYQMDAHHYASKLTKGERNAVDYILSFFAVGDAVININIRQRFRQEISIPEVGVVYDYITAMENIHAEVYSLLLENIIVDPIHKQKLLDAASKLPEIEKMISYMKKCIESDEPIAMRLLRIACVEGIFFQGCFCIIYWFASRNLMPALCQSNMFIARDERDHTTFSLMLYSDIITKHKIPIADIYKIFEEAVQIASEFTRGALPEGTIDIDADKMTTYLQFIADKLLSMIKIPVRYGSKDPFTFLKQLSFPPSVNFFEKRATEYTQQTKAVAVQFDDVADI